MLQLSGRSSAPEVLVHSQCATPRTLFVSLLQAPKAEEQSHRDTSRRCGLSVSLDTALQLWMGGKNAKKCIVPSPCGKQNKKSFPHFSWQGDRQSAHAHPFHFLLVQGVSFMEDRTWPHIVRCIYLCRCSAVIYASIYAVIYAVNMHVLCNCRYADALEERSTSRRMCLRGFRSDSGRHGSKQGAK